MSELIISVSGLRGIVGETLTPEVAIRFVGAFLAGLRSRGPVVVTRDGRATGPMLAHAVNSAAMACGFEVLYGGVGSTPTTGVLVRELNAVAGIQISASHNPPAYNGIKLFGPDGRVIPGNSGQQVIERFQAGKTAWRPHDGLGSFRVLDDTTSHHLSHVLATVNVPRIRKQRFKVVLDSNHGAGSVMGRELLNALNCDFQILGGISDGLFGHPPEPTAANLMSVAEMAVDFQADAVFCQDPDADRLAIIDAGGKYIGEEYTVALVMDHVLATIQGHVVTNCSTSRMAADLAEKHGCTFSLSAVGEANVTDEMIATRAVYGGEGNGGPIDPRVGLVRDSFVGMAQVLDSMASSGKSISQLVAGLPKYEICKSTVAIERQQVPALLNGLRDTFGDARMSTQDGLRLDWKDRWLLVRPSNTEPIVRAVAEARTIEAAQALCDRTAEVARSITPGQD